MGSHMKEAIEQMQRKEETGLNYLYAKTFNYVYLRAKSVLKKETDIQKLMKEVYTQAFVSAGQIKEEEMYEWLGKLTYSQGAKSFRKKKAREATALEFEKNDLISGKNANSASIVEVVGKAIDQLPELYQATFYAFYYDCMNVVDIAEMMDCSVGVILYRLNYTAKFLKEACVLYNEETGKDRKEKAVFTVESVCYALRKWSVEHCMGMATAQTLYTSLCKELGLKAGSIPFEGVEFAGVNNTIVFRKSDDMSPIYAEIDLYSQKDKGNKKKTAFYIGAAAIVVVLAVVLVLALGGKDKTGEQPVLDGTESDDMMVDEPVADEPVTDEPVTDEPVTDEPVADEPVADEQVSDVPDGDEPVENEPVENEPVEDEPVVDEPVADEQTESESEYLLPTSDSAALTEADLASLTKEELRLARNEIYARYGMVFGVEDLDNYFATKSWYSAKYETEEFYENVELNDIEEANVEFILSVEQNME